MAATPLRPHDLSSINEENLNNDNIDIQQINKINNTNINNNNNNNCNKINNNNINNDNNNCVVEEKQPIYFNPSNKIKISLRPDCQCTNISIMQLFHEMKQEFPKIPDQIVSECVVENCHNRNACVNKLKLETANLAQAYPTQSLMRSTQILNNKNCNNKVNEQTNNNNINNNNNNNIDNCVNNESLNNDNKECVKQLSSEKDELNSDNLQIINQNSVLYRSNNNNNNKNDNNNNNNNDNVLEPQKDESEKIDQSFVNRQRPTTLNLVQETYNPNIAFFNPTGFRPTRSAPPPPVQSSFQKSSTSPFQYNHQNNEIPSQNNNNNDPIVSVNVTVSPVSSRPLGRSRHTTALNIQPELPFFQEISSNSRSFTSVHFNLRPPSDSPQAPINITTGPALTYRSSSYNAREGHQTQVQLTIGGNGNAVAAMRTRPRHLFSPSTNCFSDLDKYSNGYKTGLNHSLEDEVIRKQRIRKEKLASELENNKKQFQTIQREIDALKTPITQIGLDNLVAEIKRLESSCQKMTQEVEEAGEIILGESDEEHNFNLINRTIYSRPPRHRRAPPPPRITDYSSGGSSNFLTNLDYSPNSNLINSSSNSIYDDNLSTNINYNNNYNPEQQWTCSMCTFQNHPLLDKCEQCDNIKLNLDNNSGGTGMMRITNSSSMRFQDTHSIQNNPSNVLLTNPSVTSSSSPSSFTPAINNSLNSFLVTK